MGSKVSNMQCYKIVKLKMTFGIGVSFSWSFFIKQSYQLVYDKKNPLIYTKQMSLKSFFLKFKGFRPPRPAWESRLQRVRKADQAGELSVLLISEEPISKAQDSPTKSPERSYNR